MIFGTVFTGQVKTQEKQYIETKVFCFIIPLWVVSTLLVTEWIVNGRKGIEIKTNSISVIASIIRPLVTLLLVGVVGVYLGNDNMQWLVIPGIVTILLFCYCWFYFGRTTKYERFVREQFGKQIGLFIMPNWLKNYEVKTNYEKLKKIYVTNFRTSDWKEKITKIPYYNEEFSLAYCITALENEYEKNPDTEKILKDIAAKEI
jgi:hypothetical protein